MQSVDYGTIRHAALRSLLRDNLCGKEKSPQKLRRLTLSLRWRRPIVSGMNWLLPGTVSCYRAGVGANSSHAPVGPHRACSVCATESLSPQLNGCGGLFLSWAPSRTCRRGPVTAPGECGVARAVVQQVAAEARRARAFVLWVEPPWDEDDGPVLPCNFVTTPNYIQPPATGTIDLRPPCDTVLAGFQSSMRRNVRLADRRGLAVREGSTERDWQEFYSLLTEQRSVTVLVFIPGRTSKRCGKSSKTRGWRNSSWPNTPVSPWAAYSLRCTAARRRTYSAPAPAKKETCVLGTGCSGTPCVGQRNTAVTPTTCGACQRRQAQPTP